MIEGSAAKSSCMCLTACNDTFLLQGIKIVEHLQVIIAAAPWTISRTKHMGKLQPDLTILNSMRLRRAVVLLMQLQSLQALMPQLQCMQWSCRQLCAQRMSACKVRDAQSAKSLDMDNTDQSCYWLTRTKSVYLC